MIDMAMLGRQLEVNTTRDLISYTANNKTIEMLNHDDLVCYGGTNIWTLSFGLAHHILFVVHLRGEDSSPRNEEDGNYYFSTLSLFVIDRVMTINILAGHSIILSVFYQPLADIMIIVIVHISF